MVDTTMKQGQAVRWVDGMGFEAHGIVDWRTFEQENQKVPVRSDVTGRVSLIDRKKLEIAELFEPKPSLNVEPSYHHRKNILGIE